MQTRELCADADADSPTCRWTACAAAIRSSMVGCVWKNQQTTGRGIRLGEVLRAEAAHGRDEGGVAPGQRQREAVGAALVVARPGDAERREQQRDGPGREHEQRQRGGIAEAVARRP